ncbi:MAG TPA: hypothetical protein VHG27_01645 [Xanthobacteraceae bacterium]|nr:hypothetical protein [Xanthobacteraceae bacterium]
MPKKHEDAERIGGPGAAHENRKHPEKSQSRGLPPQATKSTRHSGVSGGGGEPDAHHSQDPRGKAGD